MLAVWAMGVVRRIWVGCVAFHGTGGVTRLSTAAQLGRIVDLYRTEYTGVGWRIGGKSLPVNVSVAARTGGRVATFLEIVLGTGGMTRLTTAAQLGIIGDRRQTDHTWFGLSHHLLGFWIIHELKCEMKRGFFYRETKGSRGREGANERKTPSCFGRGRGGGTPLPPP